MLIPINNFFPFYLVHIKFGLTCTATVAYVASDLRKEASQSAEISASIVDSSSHDDKAEKRMRRK